MFVIIVIIISQNVEPKMIQSHCYFDQVYSLMITSYVMNALARLQNISMKDPTPLENEGPAISRMNAITSLIRTRPTQGEN